MNKKNENLNWYYDGEGSLVNGDKILFASPAGGTCPFCGEERYMNWEFDAYFCPCCNLWLEEKCSSPNCRYCAGRPENPLD